MWVVCNHEAILFRNQPALLTFLNFLSFSSRLPLELLLIDRETTLSHCVDCYHSNKIWQCSDYSPPVVGAYLRSSLRNDDGPCEPCKSSGSNSWDPFSPSFLHASRKKERFSYSTTCIVTWYTVFRFRTLPPNGVLWRFIFLINPGCTFWINLLIW